MSTLPRIHGRIAAKPRHTLATEIVTVRYALARRDMQRRADVATFYALAVLGVIAGVAAAVLLV